MKKNQLIICLLMLTALSGMVAFAGSSKSPLRQKARYYYLEGAREQAVGNMPEAYEYFKKAYLTDPTYEEAASAYGMNRLMVRNDSLQSEKELLKSLDMMRRFVDTYPTELFEVRTYAYVAASIDTISEAIRVYERIDSLKPGNTMNLLQLSDAYMSAHQEGKALETLERFETFEGKSPELSLKKMSIMLVKGDTLDAVKEADDLIATNPRDPAFHILKGNLYEVIGNQDSTIACYLKAEEVSPDNGVAKISLANVYKNMGDSVAYDREVYEALLSEDFQLEEKLSLLQEYLQTLLNDSSDTSRGDHLFEVLMEQYPHEPKVIDLSARYSAAKGDFVHAEEQIGYAIDQDPSSIEYWGQLMRYQLADNRAKDAMKTYERAKTHIEPTEALILMYATATSMDKDYDESEKAYGDLLHSIDPSLPLTDSITDGSIRNILNYEGLSHVSSLYNMLGDMYYQAGKLEKAYKAYDNSLYFLPNNPLTLNNYAYFLCENGGDLDKAQEMSKTAIEQDPDNDTYLDTYAWILFRKKDYKEALEYQLRAIEKAEERGNEAAEFYNHLGDILFMNHQPDEALDNWKRALELEPDNALLKKKVEHKTFFFE